MSKNECYVCERRPIAYFLVSKRTNKKTRGICSVCLPARPTHKQRMQEMADLTELSYELHGQSKDYDLKECDVHKNKKSRNRV